MGWQLWSLYRKSSFPVVMCLCVCVFSVSGDASHVCAYIFVVCCGRVGRGRCRGVRCDAVRLKDTRD